ncbi:U4/U6 small nuclear ribonucleoprotein Prp31 [Toxocara canis]|uniref:U4/U6 small nuclear ribonucleoprotein Prp31 n=1 Tax=Toxocara canis TaxID=6265 RepID=A0A0B2VU96_TOXCA|nr:U4/U6 small nuclear ribonucleoprotein Prp31 [Toxocara canis]
MSLADELLADLEEEGEELEENGGQGAVDGVVEEIQEQLPNMNVYDRVGAVAKLASTQEYKELIAKMEGQLSLEEIPPVSAPLEADPQYKLIVQLSGLAADIDQELNVIHKFVRDKYEKRFPELESLVPNALEYLAVAKLLGNDISTKGQNKQILSEILAPATCIVVSVTASTTQGKPLDADELYAVQEACDLAEKMHNDRLNMYRLVESRMALIAPNLCEILGAGTAAMIVSKAGGLAPLARLPACNVLVLGAQKKTLSGFSSTSVLPNAGFIFFHPIVQGVPPDFRQKVARLVSAKATLAARVDSLHESSDGSLGKNLFEQVKHKIEKMLEPPPVKSVKPLPKPLDKASKKRGGRRVRKMKERLGMTEMRRKANRMNFGELSEDVIQESVGFSLGQATSGPSSSGRIRGAAVDPKTRARQKLQKAVDRQRAMGGLTSVRSKASGTASSVTFTPVQGIEIVNPTIKQERVGSSSTTYFSPSASFVKVQTPFVG